MLAEVGPLWVSACAICTVPGALLALFWEAECVFAFRGVVVWLRVEDAVLRMCQDGWSGDEHGSNSRVNQRTLMKYSSVQLKRVEIKEGYLKRTPSVIKGRPRYLKKTPGVIKES